MLRREPALRLPAGASAGAGLAVPSDGQLSGRRAAAALLAACEARGRRRFAALLCEPVEAILLESSGGGDSGSGGAAAGERRQQRRVSGLRTVGRTVSAPRVVIAAGAWTGALLSEQLGRPAWAQALGPRRGVLLEVPPPAGMPRLHAALMEAGYTQHYAPRGGHTGSGGGWAGGGEAGGLGITFTASTAASGSLLVGSSREFAGLDKVTRLSKGSLNAVLV